MPPEVHEHLGDILRDRQIPFNDRFAITGLNCSFGFQSLFGVTLLLEFLGEKGIVMAESEGASTPVVEAEVLKGVFKRLEALER